MGQRVFSPRCRAFITMNVILSHINRRTQNLQHENEKQEFGEWREKRVNNAINCKSRVFWPLDDGCWLQCLCSQADWMMFIGLMRSEYGLCCKGRQTIRGSFDRGLGHSFIEKCLWFPFLAPLCLPQCLCANVCWLEANSLHGCCVLHDYFNSGVLALKADWHVRPLFTFVVTLL